jgi:hypothetical protein
MHVAPKYSVDGGLISLAMPTKKPKYIGVETQRDLLLLTRPPNGMAEKFGTEFWDLREINL